MFKDRVSKMLIIMQAFLDGKEIEYNAGTDNKPSWVTSEEFCFSSEPSKYRIKPIIIKYKKYLYKTSWGFCVGTVVLADPYTCLQNLENDRDFIKWIDDTDWIEYEI